MDALFGTAMPLAARFFIAFLVVLALIGLIAWLVRRFGAHRLGSSARGRQPRLAVIDAATVDGRRRLVLIRRDNTEHLLMIGGPTDVVVESNIVRAAAAATSAREPGRVSMTAETTARIAQTVEGPLPPPAAEFAPPAISAISPRPIRSLTTEEPWLSPEAGARARPATPADSLTGLAAELSAKLGAPAPETPATRIEPPAARSEPIPPRTAVSPPVTPSIAQPETPTVSAQHDRNLAEMAQQLEAALRRTPTSESRPPVTDPLAVPPTAKIPPRAPVRDTKLRIEPKFEPKVEPRFEPKFEPKREMRPEPKFELKPEAPTAPDKKVYDSLEEEMASLLGRPSDKT